jgi:hypothetical protein
LQDKSVFILFDSGVESRNAYIGNPNVIVMSSPDLKSVSVRINIDNIDTFGIINVDAFKNDIRIKRVFIL